MMKIKFTVILVVVMILTGCSNFRETSVSEDGELRRVMTDNMGEMEIPADPDDMVILRPIDVLNAHMLGGDIAAVPGSVEHNEFVNAHLEDVEFIGYEDLEAVRAVSPDVIVTSSQDVNSTEYEEIAPTLALNYSDEFFNTYGDRIYLIQLNKIGVMLGEQEKASELANDWLERMTELRRELDFDPGGLEAAVLVEGSDGFYLYNEFSAYGTEVMYDVLNFNMSEDALELIQEHPFNQFQIAELENVSADYVLVNRQAGTDENDLAEELSRTLEIPADNIIIVDAGDFITNDLISLEGQSQIILEHLE